MSTSWKVRIEPVVLDLLATRARDAGRPAPGPQSRPFDEGWLDSVAYVELVEALERRLDIEVDAVEIDPEALDTVAGLVDQLSGAVMED